MPPPYASKKSPDGGVPYVALCIIIALTMLLNISQLSQLESVRWTSAAIARQWQEVDQSVPPYFQRTKRLFSRIPARQPGIRKDLVKAGDFVYYNTTDSWDAAPIVMEKYKLIFFTLPKCGCTVWKQLFRRMMGYPDWNIQDGQETFLPHNSQLNGLKYLSDYPLEQANEFMTSPEWTRAIMVREPKQRFLSAFLDKAVSNDHKHIFNRCCPDDERGLDPSLCEEAKFSSPGFLKLVHMCDDDHWRPQHLRMESKYWPYVDVVLHVETAYPDAKDLLQRIGAWEDYGLTGWGRHGNLSIFASTEVQAAGEHATWANWQHWKWFSPGLEEQIERFYMADYENPLFNFTRGVCLTCTTTNSSRSI